MKFKDFLEKVDGNTHIEVVVNVGGIEFRKIDVANTFRKTKELDDMDVSQIGVTYATLGVSRQIKLARLQVKLEKTN